jgi:hypothetical protein
MAQAGRIRSSAATVITVTGQLLRITVSTRAMVTACMAPRTSGDYMNTAGRNSISRMVIAAGRLCTLAAILGRADRMAHGTISLRLAGIIANANMALTPIDPTAIDRAASMVTRPASGRAAHAMETIVDRKVQVLRNRL